MADPAPSDLPRDTRPGDSESAARPYLMILLAALLIGLVLAGYLWLYRAEIIAILTQSPT